MPDTFTKDPDEILDYMRDWTALLESGETIVNSEWIPVTGIQIITQFHAPQTATVWLTGGTVNKRYRLTNRITTSQGRVHDKTLTFKIQQK